MKIRAFRHDVTKNNTLRNTRCVDWKKQPESFSVMISASASDRARIDVSRGDPKDECALVELVVADETSDPAAKVARVVVCSVFTHSKEQRKALAASLRRAASTLDDEPFPIEYLTVCQNTLPSIEEVQS